MRFTTVLIAALAATGANEFMARNTPLAFVQPAAAQDLSSSMQFKVNKLAQTIAKSRQSLAGQGAALAADAFKAKQFKQRVDSYANALKKYPANTDPAWAAAQAQLTALQQELAAVMGSGAAPAAAPAQAAAPAAPAPAAGTPKLDSSARIKLNALIAKMQRTRKRVETKGAEDMQTAAGVEKYKKDMGDYAKAISAYGPFKGDPTVTAAVEEYQTLRASLSTAFGAAKTMKAGNDAVQAELAALDAAMAGNKAPKSLLAPFTEAEAQEWVDRINAVQTTSARIMSEVSRIGGANPLPIVAGSVSQGGPYDKQDIQRMYSWSQKQARDAVAAVEETERNLASQFDFQDKPHALGYFRDLDPADKQDLARAFLAEGAEQAIYSRLDSQLAMAESFAAYEKAKTGTVSAAKQARVDEVIALRKRYGEQRIEAVGASVMPDPASTDAERLSIAKDLLARPKYEFGEHGPVVLTSADIVTREKTVTRDEIKDVDISLSGDITWSGTRETWNYDWDEFFYATPLRDENGDWYIWWNKAAYYRSGAESTPLNQWISAGATKGNLILEENFR